MPVITVEKQKLVVQEGSHAPGAELPGWIVCTAMGSVSETESQVDIHLETRQKLTEDRRMSKLSKETNSLTQHNTDVTEALRRIRLDAHLSTDDMRAAIDEVLAMVSGNPSSHPILKHSRHRIQ
jgi:hypothetical protein